MTNLNAWDWIAIILVIIGGLNWGIIGLFGLDVVGSIFGTMSIISRVIYVLVGIGAVYLVAVVSRLERRSSAMA